MNVVSDIQLIGGGVTDVSSETGGNGAACESVYRMQSVTESSFRDTKLSEESEHIHVLTSNPGSLSSCSAREPEDHLELTDAWSSIDAADSPRIPRETMLRRMVFSHGGLDSSSDPSPINVDLPDCPSGFCATRSHSSASTDCTERECVRVEKQRFKLSLETTDTLNLPDSQLHQTLAPHVKARLNQEQMCCEGHFERPLVSSEGLPVSIESTGFCDNQSRDFTSEHTLCSSTNAPTIDYSIQDMPSKLEDARFNWSQMQLTLPPEVLFVGVADQKSCTDAGLYPQSPHSKASMETYPKTKGEMGSNESNCKNASNIPLEDNEQCYIDGDMVLIRDEEFSETSKTKDKSLKMLQKLETKSTDQNCASTEQEFFNVSCKKSRKRNKVLKDSFIGILKMPKRSNAGDFLTPSTSQENSPEIIWSDDNNNTSTLKDKQTFPLAHALKQNLDCKQCHFKRDTSTSVEMSVFLDVSHQNMSLCSPNIVDTVGHKSLLVEEEAVIEKKIEVERDDKRPFDRQNKKLISGSRRRDFENCQRGHHHAESNCIPIDQRISEVVKEHMRMSVKYWAGGNSNSELDSESSPNLNVLPTCHSNICDLPKDLHPIENHVAAGLLEIITPDSISQQSLISSERLSIDGTIDMTKVSHGKDFAHYNSLTVTSVNQPSNITKDFVSRQDSSETKILSDSQLSPIIQGKDVTINVDIRGDNSQDVSGFTVVTLNDQASYNSGAACLADKSHENILNLALDNHKGCPENIHKPKLLPTRWSIFTLETPKDCSVCQENVLERDVPFLNMDNVITFSGNNNKQTVNQNCSLQQTLKPRGTMSEALPNIVFAHEKDIFVDSEHDILKNQYQMTSACASGQLDLHVFHHHEALESLSDKGSLKLTIENTEIHNSQRLANNLPSVESIKMLTVNQTEKRDRGHACVRKELQRDTHCATNISQDLPKSDSSSETQVDTIHKICVIVDPDHKKKHQRLKRDKCHVEKWLKAQCNVANFASKQTKDCQMAKNENVSITETQLAKCPVTRLDGPSEINTTDPLPSQRTQECSDVNRKILGDICRDIISKEKHTKTSKCPILHRFTGSSVINCNKEKSKKFRRSKAHAPPSSSCNSTIKSSSDEEEDITPRQHPSKSLSTRMMPRTQTKGKLKEVIHGNGEARYQSKSQSPHSKDNTNMEACAGWNLGKYGNSNVTINVGQKDHYPNGQSAQALAMSSGLKDTQMSHHTTKPQDSAMHFASSDVNPFVHQWKEQQIQKCYKNQVFGSAADISCKSLLPDPTDKRITRCCSVDNGLNLQNCPFNSHLSTYANNKGLSSTLSSMEEYFKDQTSPKAHHEGHANQVSGVDNQNKPLIQNVNVSSSCTDVPGDPGNSSGQVDEIMLVCCSEQESQCNRFRIPETHNTQDHSTQTSINPVTMTQTTINHGNIQRNNSLRRNSTPVTVSQNTKETNKETTTWASLQNMSEHLSQLIHNTSDLLGNVQGMRSGDSNLKQSPIRNGTSSHLYSFKDWKKHCSTQAAVDIGIQTESTAIQDKMSSHQTLYTERPTNHEVNVIVKVIGSEVLNVSQNQLKNRQDDTFQSMPDLQINSCPFNQTSVLEPESFPHKFPSIATVEHNNHSNPAIRHKSNECCEPKILSCSKGLAVTAACNDFPEIVKLESPNVLRRSDPGISYRKQVSFTDRACSPILTVGPRSNSNKSLKEHQHVEMQKISQEYLMQCSECQSTPCLSYGGQEACRSFTKNDQMPGHNSLDQSEMSWDISMIKSAGSISLENVSALRLSGPKGSDGCPESPSLSIDQYIPDETSVVTCEKERESTRWSVPSVLSSNAVTQGNHVAAFKQDEESISTLGHRRSYRRHLSEGPSESSSGVYQPSPIGDYPIQFQEDDMLSPAPSECNTDVLLNINPVTQTFNIQHHSPQPGNPELPVDLPVHNKFTNWSGISQHPSDRGKTKRSVNSAAHIPPAHEAQRNQADWTALHGQESGCSPSPGYPFENDKHTRPHMRPRLSLSPESSFSKDRKRREIERLRQEREQVMATVHLDMNHNPLTVELTEAKLHHGRGETDTLLKMLASGEPKVGEPSAVLTKQQLYDRHRRSIDGLRQEREARLQTCRRARSLSPGKHHSPQSPQSKTPPQEAVFSRVPALPSRRRDYLQQLRQEVVASSRIPGPPRGEGHYPSEIEQLLRDYGRAREEARTEIARARDRLRERTEQEKRRLQKQALSQVVKDDLQYRTRVSNSTLCTGSSLSLSSGPTSGYNSGYTVQRMDDSRPSLTLQAAAVLDDGLNGLKVRSRPPLRSSQTLKPQRAWLSAQDVRLEPAVPGSDPLMSSYPPSPSSLRRRTASFGSASSISTAYQDLASCLLGRALAEVRLAAAGNMENLVMGKVAAGWRYHGVERGVQAFYKPSSSPSVHSFMGAVELERPLASLWSMVQDHSKIHLYQEAVRSTWTQPLDDCTQLVYLLTETSSCHLKHPRDFCCISTVSQQDELCVLAMQSVFEESLPRPHVEAVRGEMLPSAWVLQATTRHGREVVRVIYLLQVDLGSPSLPQRLLGTVARRQAAVLAELDSLFSL